MEKKVKCPLDGRSFKTKAALAQHRAASHGGSGPGPSKGRVSQPKFSRRDMAQTMAAQPQRVVGSAGTDQAVLSGLDRLYHVEDVKAFAAGGLVLHSMVTPQLFKRLGTVSEAFQYVEYQELEFQVEPQITAASSGGYVVGFVGDPDDAVSTLQQLTATKGSVTTKWWQSSVVRANFVRKQYYTTKGAELREYSPGIFALMVDGKASQSGSLTVFCRWRVRLWGAIMQPKESLAKTVVLDRDVYVQDGHQGLWVIKSSTYVDTAADILGSTYGKLGATFRIPYPVGLVKPNDNQFALHHFVYVQAADGVFLCVNSPTDWYEAKYTYTNIVLTKGTVLEVVNSLSAPGEEKEPSSSGSEMMTAVGGSSARELLQLLRQLVLSPPEILQSSTPSE